MIQDTLGNLLGEVCLVYIDDVVIWGDTPEECSANVKKVMQCLVDAGIMCNGAKYCFYSEEIELLGHIVSKGCVKP